jgi:hypothetical protein
LSKAGWDGRATSTNALTIFFIVFTSSEGLLELGSRRPESL